MIRDIILNQQRELEQKQKEKYIVREAVIKSGNTGLINVIIGPRRAGKSFFGMHAAAGTSSMGYVNFDDERLIGVTNFDQILEAVRAVYAEPRVLLLDEIQNLPRWELIVNRLQREGMQLVITGSNSTLLSSELATHLTGRYLPTHIFTFSFREFLAIHERTYTESELGEKFLDYLIHGGYPEPWIKSLDFKDYLQVLFDSILFKDIVKRHRIRFGGTLESLATWLISNISSVFSFTSLSKDIRISSVHTLQKYLNFLEEAFIFFTIPRFSYKVREQQKSGKKIYCFDNGFYSARAFQFSPDYGRLLENLIATELKKRSLAEGIKIFYWKGREQEEVDFVIQEGLRISQLIQVCWSVENSRTREREVRSLLKASRELNCIVLKVITNDYERTDHASWFGIKGEVEFVPARKWLMK
jgi:hypothetical protein